MFNNLPPPPPDGGLSPNRLRRGLDAKWNETVGWVDRDGVPLPETMFVIAYTTALEMWKDHKAEYKTEHPLPDPDLLNSAIPATEWENGLDGKPTPPWKKIYVVYMIDEQSGTLYTYKNSTWGCQTLYEQLVEQITVMEMLRGRQVRPIVRLEKRPMKTEWGMKSRPFMKIIDWREISGGICGGPPLPPQTPTPPQLSGPATEVPPASTAPTPSATPTATTEPSSGSVVRDNTKPVKPVTVGEYIADELPPWA